jgi:probable F420-dependent oxidoreductase
MIRARTREQWEEHARKLEDMGYATMLMPDHFEEQLSPMPALTCAALATTSLRVGTIVLGNDYRHPVVLAMEAATLDLLSNGRLELGIGAGWMRSDYAAAGMSYDRPGARIERFAESLQVLKGAFGEEPFSFSGKHYTITNYNAQPKPVQKPHPPIMIGGGGRRMLSLAGREANIISINFNLAPGAVNQEVLRTGDPASTDEKVAWIREAAGGRFDDIELNAIAFTAVVTDDAAKLAERMAPGFATTPAELLESPHVLLGSTDQMAEALQRRRERYGISYWVFPQNAYEPLAPLVKKLAGT